MTINTDAFVRYDTDKEPESTLAQAMIMVRTEKSKAAKRLLRQVIKQLG